MRQRILLICQWIIIFVGAALMLMIVVFFTWASDKGFDITDEGFYLAASQYPEEVMIVPSSFHHFTGLFFKALNYNIVLFRVAGMLLTIGAGALGAFGLLRLLRSVLDYNLSNYMKAGVIAFVCTGALLYYNLFLLTPSYNLLNNLGLTTSGALFCLALARLTQRTRADKIVCGYMTAIGVCIGFCFFAKFPAALSLIPLYSVMLLLWPPLSIKRLILCSAFIALGFVFLFSLYVLGVQSMQEWWIMFKRGVEGGINLDSNHGLSSLGRYLKEIMRLSVKALKYFGSLHLALLVGFLVIGVMRRLGREMRWVPQAFILVLFVVAGWKAYSLGLQWGGRTHSSNVMRFYVAWFFLLATVLGLSLWYRRDVLQEKSMIVWHRLMLIGLLLGLLPFAGAVGTNNPIFIGALFNMTPWFGLLIFMLIVLSKVYKNHWILLLAKLIIVAFASNQIVSAGVFEPYRLNTGILEQRVVTEIGWPSSNLKLDPATHQFFVNLRHTASESGFKPGNDVLAFFNMPGAVFAMGGRSPGIPWYNSGYEGSHLLNEMGLSLVSPERLQKAFILRTPNDPQAMPDLSKFGINFPTNYVLCGELFWPVRKEKVQLWKPRILDEISRP